MKVQNPPCRQCEGLSVILEGDKQRSSTCKDCLAEKLIGGRYTQEQANTQCGCLANGHKKGVNPKPSEKFIKTHEELIERRKKEEEARQEIVYDFDKKKQESLDYYTKRRAELDQMDKDHGSPEWIVD